MVLSPDNRDFLEYGGAPTDLDGNVVMTRERLPLATGRGVRIGDSIARVKRLLGKPRFERTMHGSGRTFLMRYRFAFPSKEMGDDGPIYDEYDAAYKFVDGKLWEIAFHKDLIGGG